MPKEPEAVEDLPSPGGGGSSGGGGGGGSLIPVLAIVILIPVITIGLAEFYIFPKVKEIVAAAAPHSEEDGMGSHGGGGGHDVTRGEVVYNVEFNDIVANLRGALKSRYIKVSITVESRVNDFPHMMEVERAKILDATISVLSNLTLQDLEEPGIKNIVRSDLLNAYGSALHGNIIDNLYFSEFVVQ